MRTAALLLSAIALALPAPLPAQPAPTAPAGAPAPAPAPAPGEEMGLLVDFVELGRVSSTVGRDLAMVDLLNLSPQTLDVVVGESSGTLEPKQRIIARVKAGDQNVTVTSREKGVPPMEGRLRLDAGLHYELALAYGPVPKVDAELAPPGIDTGSGAGAGSEIAPKPKSPSEASPAPRTESRSKSKGGKVDVGRRPRS